MTERSDQALSLIDTKPESGREQKLETVSATELFRQTGLCEPEVE